MSNVTVAATSSPYARSHGARPVSARCLPSPALQTEALGDLGRRLQAVQLIHRGLRMGALRSLFPDVSSDVLKRLYREVRGEAGQPGRMPTSFASQLKTPSDAAAGVVLLSDFISIALPTPGEAIDPAALIATWDRFFGLVGAAHFSPTDVTLDITALWLLARDYQAGHARLAACITCARRHLRFGDEIAPNGRLCPSCARR